MIGNFVSTSYSTGIGAVGKSNHTNLVCIIGEVGALSPCPCPHTVGRFLIFVRCCCLLSCCWPFGRSIRLRSRPYYLLIPVLIQYLYRNGQLVIININKYNSGGGESVDMYPYVCTVFMCWALVISINSREATQTYHLEPRPIIDNRSLAAQGKRELPCSIFPLHQGKISSAQSLSGLDSPSQGSRGQLTSIPPFHL